MQESIRSVAQASKYSLEVKDTLPINDLVKEAYNILGEKGVIRSAENHFCSECTHQFKQTADLITEDDPAAVIGLDENHTVPVLTGEDAELAIQDAAQARDNALHAMNVDSSPSSVEESPVKLVVLDGVVMGPKHCAYDNCTKSLKNARGGVFCEQHERLCGNLCHLRDCNNPKEFPSKTCARGHSVQYTVLIVNNEVI